MELKRYKDRVMQIMDMYPETRNNDGRLIAHYIYHYENRFVRKDENGELCVRLSDFKHMPPFNSITRARRIIQNDNGLFLPTDPMVRKARRIKEENYKNAEVRESK